MAGNTATHQSSKTEPWSLWQHADPESSVGAYAPACDYPTSPALDLSASTGTPARHRYASGQAPSVLPTQNPPSPSANTASAGEMGIPSDFPKHFIAGP